MRRTVAFLVMLAVLASLMGIVAPDVRARQPEVRAVLFHADGCSHCQVVIDEVLPPLQLKYGNQLRIAMIEVSGEADYDYFRHLEDSLQIPVSRRGVPALFIGDRILVGDQEIPKELPGLIQKYLAAGGVDYPALPGLAERLPKADAATSACSPATPCPDTPAPKQVALASNAVRAPSSALAAEATADEPASQGFELATAVAVLLALSVIYALAAAVMAGMGRSLPALPSWTENLIPILCVVGLGVAGYLTFVETQNVKAVCGPVGDCNSVQASPYAKLFGVVPVGLLGLAGYVGIVAAWAIGRWGSGLPAVYAPVLLLAMSLFGTLFSLYLTYIELAVILAVCIWCLSSAVIQALILILAVGPAMRAFQGEEEGAGEEVA